MRLFINGTQVASRAQTGSITTNANPVSLGNQTGFSEFFGGYADEFRIWNIARTETEIQNSMNSSLDPATQTGLVSYYSVNQGISAGTNTGLITLPDQKGANNGTLTNFALSGSTSNYITQNSIIALPVQWQSFIAQQQHKKVSLLWSTASEHGTKDFLIEHSTTGLDWSTITNLPASGNSTTTKNYSYLHSSPAIGMNFYRIQQRDIDGRGSYSSIRSVKLLAYESTLVLVTNPVTNGRLQVDVSKAAGISLYDINAKMLYKKAATTGPLWIDVSHYKKGTYLLKANEQVIKVIIQ
jgi:hypothetical protein